MGKLTQAEANSLYGPVVLMGGNESLHWLARDVDRYANFAKTHGIDSVTLKVADGTWVWHTPSDVKTFRDIALDNGVGFVPFIYSYGNRFGSLGGEIALIHQFIDANENAGIVVNMEKEWEGHTDWAKTFVAKTKNKTGPIVLSTFGKPSYHNFTSVLKVLSPVVDVMGPEEYTDFLAKQEFEFDGYVIAPEFDLTSDFGPNDVLAHVREAKHKGHPAWLWTYTTAQTRQPLVRDISDIMHGKVVATVESVIVPPDTAQDVTQLPTIEMPAVVIPETENVPMPVPTVAYVTEPGVSFSSLAERFLHDSSRWKEIRDLSEDFTSADTILPVGVPLRIPAS